MFQAVLLVTGADSERILNHCRVGTIRERYAKVCSKEWPRHDSVVVNEPRHNVCPEDSRRGRYSLG